MVQGAGAALADLHQLCLVERTGIPTNVIQTTYCFKSFKVLLHAVLGASHPVTREFDAFLRHWTSSEIMLDTALAYPDAAGQAVHWIQLRISSWFTNQVRSPAPIPAPDLTRLLTLIKHSEAWQTPLPQQYSRLKAPLSLPSQTTQWLQAAFSSPPQGVGPNKATQPAAGRGERCSNNNHLPEYTAFKELGLPVKEIRDKAKVTGKPVPTNNQGTEMCLSFHILGFCWNNCGRAQDHKPHSPAETTKLQSWCKTCYRAGGPNTN